MTKTGPTFSLCMIVKNEAHNLPRSLGPVCDCFDEAVIVDTGSKDGTPELALSYGARVIEREWRDDFAAARNVSLAQATGDWIMWLDADNHVSPAGVNILRSHLDNDRRSIIWCTEVVAPVGERLAQTRVFPRRPEVFFQGRVHEQLVHPSGYRSIMTQVEILHWGYADKAAARTKGERNLQLLEKAAEEDKLDLYGCYQMGRTLLNLRRFERACFWLEKACQAEEEASRSQGVFRHAHILLSRARERSGQLEESEKILKRLISLAPGYGPGHYALGRLFYASGRWHQAAQSFALFLEIGVNDPVAGFNPLQMRFTAAMLSGRALEMTGQWDECREAFYSASRLDPGNPEPHLALAALASKTGFITEAQAHINQCLQLSPGNRRARRMLDEIVTHA